MTTFLLNFQFDLELVIFLSIVGSILFGSLLRHHYLGGERVKSLQNIAVFFAEIPMHARDMIKFRTFNLDAPFKLQKHKDHRYSRQHAKPFT